MELEAQLAELLGDLSRVQTELLDVLAAKRECMAENDLTGMAALQPREAELCAQLQSCHDRRASLLQDANGDGSPCDSLQQLASRLPTGESTFRQKLHDASARMRLLQHQSLTNWVLAQRSMLHLAQLLEIVATGGRLQPTYGRDDSSMSSGALVDRDA